MVRFAYFMEPKLCWNCTKVVQETFPKSQPNRLHWCERAPLKVVWFPLSFSFVRLKLHLKSHWCELSLNLLTILLGSSLMRSRFLNTWVCTPAVGTMVWIVTLGRWCNSPETGSPSEDLAFGIRLGSQVCGVNCSSVFTANWQNNLAFQVSIWPGRDFIVFTTECHVGFRSIRIEVNGPELAPEPHCSENWQDFFFYF